jgi:hypothetical protein
VAIRSGIGRRELLGCCRKVLLLATFRGTFSNCFSLVAEVGRSSNKSSSWPSPKLRFRWGCVSFFGGGWRARAEGARSRLTPARLGVSF